MLCSGCPRRTHPPVAIPKFSPAAYEGIFGAGSISVFALFASITSSPMSHVSRVGVALSHQRILHAGRSVHNRSFPMRVRGLLYLVLTFHASPGRVIKRVRDCFKKTAHIRDEF
jgi:hypothetical protein